MISLNLMIFKENVNKLEVEFKELIHIGDRYSNDIQGANDVGAQGVYCEAIKSRKLLNGEVVEHRFDSYQNLFEVLECIEGGLLS